MIENPTETDWSKFFAGLTGKTCDADLIASKLIALERLVVDLRDLASNLRRRPQAKLTEKEIALIGDASVELEWLFQDCFFLLQQPARREP
jgi:hypothetical protein